MHEPRRSLVRSRLSLATGRNKFKFEIFHFLTKKLFYQNVREIKRFFPKTGPIFHPSPGRFAPSDCKLGRTDLLSCFEMLCTFPIDTRPAYLTKKSEKQNKNPKCEAAGLAAMWWIYQRYIIQFCKSATFCFKT